MTMRHDYFMRMLLGKVLNGPPNEEILLGLIIDDCS